MAEAIPARTSCSECKHRMAPAPLPVIQLGTSTSAGIVEALLNHLDNRVSGKEFERERVQAGEPFVRPPHHFEWCERFTLTDKQTQALTEALQRGDDGPAKEAHKAGFELALDTVNGRVIRFYALCVVKNTGQCPGFKRADSGGAS